MIDNYGLRETARTPFMLKVIVYLLSSAAAEKISDPNPLQQKTPNNFYLIEQFIERVIQSDAQLILTALTETKSEEDHKKSQKLKHQSF